jgi:hypothetical protein
MWTPQLYPLPTFFFLLLLLPIHGNQSSLPPSRGTDRSSAEGNRAPPFPTVCGLPRGPHAVSPAARMPPAAHEMHKLGHGPHDCDVRELLTTALSRSFAAVRIHKPEASVAELVTILTAAAATPSGGCRWRWAAPWRAGPRSGS